MNERGNKIYIFVDFKNINILIKICIFSNFDILILLL